MKTRNPIFIASICFGFVFAGHAQRDFSDVEIKIIPVAKNIAMLQGAGGNIGVSVGDDGILIVDDQFAPLAEKIEAALATLNPGKLKFVLNTHHHGDHTGGNGVFGAAGAVIVAQTNVRARLVADEKVAVAAYPVITYDEGASVHFNGEEIKLAHIGPGHTDGDTIVRFTGANVVHMGDQFFNGGFPYIDLGSGGSVDGYIATVKLMLGELSPDTKIIPGHGPLASVDDLKNFYAMLVETTGLIKKAIADGKTLEEIKAAGLPEKWAGWGSGFIPEERWIETVFNSVNGG